METTRTVINGHHVDLDADGNVLYWRTGKGSHRHLSSYCANFRRSIFTGDVFVIPAAEVANWVPCEACCPAEEIAAHASRARAEAEKMCPNTGVANPRRYMSTCKDCGKEGTVLRATGRLRAHKRAH